jgi:YD repeat-containing protein
MLDLLIQHATLPDGRKDMSVAVQGGRIVEVTQGLSAPAAEVVDAGGLLLSPPFVDVHFHMDATLTYGMPRVNQNGTLLEGIALWGELKPSLTRESIMERALTYCDWAVAQGLLTIRSHVDTSDPRLLAVEATRHYSPSGQPERLGQREYVWDALGRLMEVRQEAKPLARYQYDHRGLRTSKTVGPNTSHTLYDESSQPLAELDASGRITRQYVWQAML